MEFVHKILACVQSVSRDAVVQMHEGAVVDLNDPYPREGEIDCIDSVPGFLI
jgi:hypothetical protein